VKKRDRVLQLASSFNKKIIIAILFSVTMLQTNSQDIHFSQFFEAPLLRNPSLAGIFTGDVRAQAVYRDQWNSFTKAYRSGSLNAEYKMPIGKADDFITTGLQILYDKSGTVGLTTTQFLPALNYHKALRDDKSMYLSLGFMGGLVQKRIDRSKMTTNTTYESGGISDGETFASPNYSFLDGSVGASFNTTFGKEQQHSFFVGFAYHHLNKPQNSFYGTTTEPLNPKYVISGGVEFTVNEYAYFSIQADQSLQGSFSESIFGALYSYKIGDPDKPTYTLSGGAFMRLKDALIPVIKIGYDPFAIAFSYDINLSQLKTVSQAKGGFELSVSYIGFLDRYNSARDKVLSPRF
jgi:type IX secretion system PorP/SprF family membrane protein